MKWSPPNIDSHSSIPFLFISKSYERMLYSIYIHGTMCIDLIFYSSKKYIWRWRLNKV